MTVLLKLRLSRHPGGGREQVIARVRKGRSPAMYSNRCGSSKLSAKVRFLLTTDSTPRIVPALCTDQFAGQNALPATCKRENGTSLLMSSRVYRVLSRSLSRPLVGVSCSQSSLLLLEQELRNYGEVEAGPVTWLLQHLQGIKILEKENKFIVFSSFILRVSFLLLFLTYSLL